MVYFKFSHFSKLNVLTILCFVILCDCRNDSNSVPEYGNRIINGIRAKDYQFPYQVSIQKHQRHHCGGSIISEVKVLTAGHCVTNKDDISSFRILAGTNNLNTKEPQNYYSVKKFSIHPDFDRRTVQYDYALVFINGQFNFQISKISMIPLATQDALPGTVCYLSGWGDVDKGRGTKIPNELQFAKITVDPPDVCERIFGNIFSSKHMLCAGQLNKENAGSGDSGGFIIIYALFYNKYYIFYAIIIKVHWHAITS